VSVKVRPALIEVDERHAFAELSEVYRKIDGYEAFADAAASAPNPDDSIRGTPAWGIGVARAPSL
jgi:hypothetical protein